MWLSSAVVIVATTTEPQVPLIERVYQAAIKYESRDLLDKSTCSGSAVGPHALLTAAHCETTDDFLRLNSVMARVAKRLHDGNDHTIYLLEGYNFPHWLTVNEEDPDKMGEPILFVGNPGGYPGVLRQGFIAGHKLGPPPTILLSPNIWEGDSGSAVVNANGEIIGVVSGMLFPTGLPNTEGLAVLGECYYLKFSKAQLDIAARF